MLKRLTIILPTLLVILFQSEWACASEALVLKDGADLYPLGPHVEFFEDKTGRLTIGDVTSPALAKRFVLDGRETPSFGLGDGVYWLRFRVSDGSSNKDGWLLEENFPLMDTFDLYVPRSDGSFLVKKAGKMQPFAGREVPHRNPVFLLPVDKEEQTFYLRAAVQSTIVFPLTILTRNELFKRDTVRLLGFGLYFGVMLAMALYNLYLFIFLRDRVYLFYVFYVFSFAMVQAAAHGFTRQFLLHDSPLADHYFMRLLILMAALTSMVFSRSFLKSSHYAPGMDKLLKFLIAIDVALIPCMFLLPGYAYLIILDINTALTPLLSAITGVTCYLRGYKAARYYLMARACLYASICAFVIGNTVLRLHNFITWYGMLVGSVLDVVLLSLALTDRVSDMRREKEKAEAEALRSSQMAMLGELAAGVAHEINTPLNTIINSAELLLDEDDRTARERDATMIKHEGRRIARIVKSLLFYARQKDDEKIAYSVLELLTGTLHLVDAKLRQDNITVTLSVAPELHEVLVHPQKVEQVFLNVIDNAAFALKSRQNGGAREKTLEITANRAIFEKRPYVRLRFHDNGPGIPPDILDKVMNPFFTTKNAGSGTGLGLSISHDIVAEHQGTLSIESKEGEYTTVLIDLPAAGGEAGEE